MQLIQPDLFMEFQSAPAIAGGRSYISGPMTGLPGLFQSAPAIAGGRSLVVLSQTDEYASFNPRPPLLAGDPAIKMLSKRRVIVSIRARHCWRAILDGWADVSHHVLFQSAPAIAGGRSRSASLMGFQSICFNPRPPLLAGDP